MPTPLDHARILDGLDAQTGLVRYALAGADTGGRDVEDPAGPARDADVTSGVAACPGWDVRQLVAHLGATHWLATESVLGTDPDTRPRGLREVMESAPAAGEGATALARWYEERSRRLLDALEAADPDAPAWTLGDSGRAGFWPRRQLHETVVHRWDVECALTGPSSTTPLTDDVALDGIDELIRVIHPMVRAGGGPAPVATLRLTATGAEGDRGDAETGTVFVLPGADGSAEVGVSGPAEALLLLLWVRIDVDDPRIGVDGDRETLRAVLAAGVAA